jgi:protein-S-isoprenylcysteine O-methyltransferase Ste14
MERSIKEKNGEHPFGDTGQLISLGLFMVIWLVDSFFWRKSTFLRDYLPLYVRLVVLGLSFIVAALLFRSGHAVVGQRQRPNGVVETGAFRYVRHPLYLASILAYFGLTVSTASFFCFALLVGIWIFHNYIATYEEKLREAKFGKEYGEYKQKTGKWVPRISIER